MAATLARLAKTMPVPLFGTTGTALAFSMAKAKTLRKFCNCYLYLYEHCIILPTSKVV